MKVTIDEARVGKQPITTVTALINWWYNNSFTQAAIEGDKTYENVKNQIH